MVDQVMPDHVVSVLFTSEEERETASGSAEPDCFGDLNLDQVVAAVTRGRAEYGLASFFHAPVRNADTIVYRQGVFRDLESREARSAIIAFAAGMRTARGLLRQQLHYRYQRETWLFEAAEGYARCIAELQAALAPLDLRSDGLRGVRDFLSGYVEAGGFRSLVAEAARIREGLGEVVYSLHIRPGRVTVGLPDPAPDYTAGIEATFERFRRGAARDYLAAFTTEPDLNHVGILDRIARLYPDTFGALDAFCEEHADFIDPTIAAFDREVQFYLGYLEFVDRLRADGLSFCYPRLSDGTAAAQLRDTFDVALAWRRAGQGMPVVPNDVRLDRPERVIVVTGPNQGGKTTFARAFGQVSYLASLGCPVAGSRAVLPLVDQVLTHFGREERLADQHGRLEEELLRMRTLLDRATPRSVMILNEVFSSTTLVDAVFLSTKVMRRLEDLNLIGLWVTFVDELASTSEATVSMVSNVLPDDPAIRTFKITRRPPEGRAYAAAIASKYRVSYERLKERLPA
jgi:DNA mismatch repair protein MutS